MDASTKKLIRDYGGTVLGAGILALLIRVFMIEAYRIPTPAMRPTLEPGDTVFVAKAPFGLRLLGEAGLERGDVILFRPSDKTGRDYIKRIIGLPGETVQISKGKVLINGVALVRNIGQHGNCGSESVPNGKPLPVCYEPPSPEDFGPEKIPADSFFVLGDFRSSSQLDPKTEKTSWGIIPRAWLRGKAMWVWLSVEPPSPSDVGVSPGRFPKVRFERMFRRIQ